MFSYRWHFGGYLIYVLLWVFPTLLLKKLLVPGKLVSFQLLLLISFWRLTHFAYFLFYLYNSIAHFFQMLHLCHYRRADFWVAAWKGTKSSFSFYGVCDYLLQATVICSVYKFSFCIKPWGNTPPVSIEMTDVAHLRSFLLSYCFWYFLAHLCHLLNKVVSSTALTV